MFINHKISLFHKITTVGALKLTIPSGFHLCLSLYIQYICLSQIQSSISRHRPQHLGFELIKTFPQGLKNLARFALV